MSDLSVDWDRLFGGGSGITLGGGSGSSGGVAGDPSETGGSITVYDGTDNLQYFTADTAEIIEATGGDIGSVENPYPTQVQIGTKYIDIYMPVCNQNGCRQQYVRTIAVPIYGANPAYSQFETVITDAQNELYNAEYTDYIFQAEEISSANADSIASNYSNDRFGDSSQIQNLLFEISSLETSLYNYAIQDELTLYYDRIDDTDNSKKIDSNQTLVDGLKNELQELIAEYDSNKKKSDVINRNKESDNWNVDTFWATEQAFDAGLGGGYAPVTQSDTLNFMQSGEVNDWMAGGNLYDSPRAGGQLFNVTGDMNTVRFLGLQDKNYNAHLQRELNGMAQLHKMLGVNAGSKSFSIL